MNKTPPVVLFVGLLGLWACSGVQSGQDEDVPWFTGEVLFSGFSPATWRQTSNAFFAAGVDDQGLTISNTSIGTGISPVLFHGTPPQDFLIKVRATVEAEGLDGGWGVEFGYRQGLGAYRALIYSSGRFCVDRAFGDYPEFIHCVTMHPAVELGEVENELGVVVESKTIRVYINGILATEFEDLRFTAGGIALAAAGAGARVRFHEFIIGGAED